MSRIVNMKRGALPLFFRAGLWHIKHYLLGRSFPLIATFQLTNRCNLRCIMCNIPNNPDRRVLPLERFTAIIKDLSKAGCSYVTMSGGEVLTIKNFFDYLAVAKSCIPSINMVTNGLLLDEAVAGELNKISPDSISISLDGMKRTHDFIRGEGAFDATVAAIERLKRRVPSARIVVNTVISPWNLDELFELVRFVEGLGVLQKFQPLNEHPRFEGQKKDYSIEDRRTIDRNRLKEFIELLLRKRHVVNSGYFLSSIPDYFFSENRSGLFNRPCLLPYFFCEFRENGLMYPCLGGTGWKGGFETEGGVAKVFSSEPYRRLVKKLENCRFCRKSFSICYIEPRVVFPFTNFLRYSLLYRNPEDAGTVTGPEEDSHLSETCRR